MGNAFDETVADMRDRVTPSPAERRQLEAAVAEIMDRTRRAVDEADVDADVLQVGSTARDTWLRGDRDIDVFVRFPPSMTREELETHGLAIGRTVLPDGELEHAEHPYVAAEWNGYDVDLVPCFAVASGADRRSAVDRTPFHNRYVKERLTPKLATDVRVLKRFAEAVGVYGSNLRTEGFSGYLTELLVIEYGDFRSVIEAAATWQPPVELDPEAHAAETFSDPLVVIDPTDPQRNVAAVVSPETVARFQHHARALRRDPRPERFEPTTPTPLDPASLRAHLDRRDASVYAIRTTPPDVVDDQLYPQLRTTERGIVRALEANEFDVLRSAAFADETAVWYFELGVDQLPAIARHEGPPVHVEEHATAFLERYRHEDDVYGPFIAEDRYVVERPRSPRDAASFLRSDAVLDAGIGKDIRREFAEGYEVLIGTDVTRLLPEFGRELATFYDPSP